LWQPIGSACFVKGLSAYLAVFLFADSLAGQNPEIVRKHDPSEFLPSGDQAFAQTPTGHENVFDNADPPTIPNSPTAEAGMRMDGQWRRENTNEK